MGVKEQAHIEDMSQGTVKNIKKLYILILYLIL